MIGNEFFFFSPSSRKIFFFRCKQENISLVLAYFLLVWIIVLSRLRNFDEKWRRIVFPSPISLEEEEEFGIRKCPIPPDTPFFTNHEAEKCRSFYPRDLNSSLLPFSLVFIPDLRCRGKLFPLISPFCIVSLLKHREREKESSAKTIKKYAQKFLFQQLQSNRSILEKFWQRWTNTRPSFERERERER